MLEDGGVVVDDLTLESAHRDESDEGGGEVSPSLAGEDGGPEEGGRGRAEIRLELVRGEK